jgi:putative endonuclease
MREYYVYMLTNRSNTVIYIGVTNDLKRRVHEHRSKLVYGFTSKYNCVKLVWYEKFNCIDLAISREKQLKNWHRSWKNELVEKGNPTWDDLARGWFS